MHRLKIALASLAVWALPGASAQARDYQPLEVINAVKIDDLREIVGLVGAKIVDGAPSERLIVRAKSTKGLMFQLVGTACDIGDVDGCQGLSMQVIYQPDGWVTDSNIGKANIRYSVVNVWLDEADDSLGVSRYVILDSGVTRRNLVLNLQVLLEIAPAAAKIAYGED